MRLLMLFSSPSLLNSLFLTLASAAEAAIGASVFETCGFWTTTSAARAASAPIASGLDFGPADVETGAPGAVDFVERTASIAAIDFETALDMLDALVFDEADAVEVGGQSDEKDES